MDHVILTFGLHVYRVATISIKNLTTFAINNKDICEHNIHSNYKVLVKNRFIRLLKHGREVVVIGLLLH